MLAKFLLSSVAAGCSEEALSIVAMLSVPHVFLPDSLSSEKRLVLPAASRMLHLLTTGPTMSLLALSRCAVCFSPCALLSMRLAKAANTGMRNSRGLFAGAQVHGGTMP